MKESTLSKQERLDKYKEALAYLKENQACFIYGLCWIFRNVLVEKWFIYKYNNTDAYQFPELFANKPETNFQGYWFRTNKERIAYLENIINTMEHEK